MLLETGFALLAAAVLGGWFAPARPRLLTPASWAACCAAAALLVVAGGRGLAGHSGEMPLPGQGPLGSGGLEVDRLSGLFLVIAFGVAIPVLLAGVTRLSADRPRLPALVAATLAAVAVIMTATTVFVFIFGWEALTFCFYLFTGFDRTRPGRARASLVTGVFGKASGSALLIGALILAGHAGTFTIADLGGHSSGTTTQVGYAVLLAGFAIKVGLVPVQIWLPPGYANAAPAARAVMAGVAVNVGFYGMWRTLDVLGPPPVWLVVIVLVAGGCTAILGIAHACVHADLTHLIAWSSVENAGVITVGYGVGLLGVHAHRVDLAAAGLLAATAQVMAHALGKSLLFTAAAGLGHDLGTTDLDRLRGVIHRAGWSGAGVIVGSWTLAGLPLAAGFTSEWLTLEALMQQFRVSGLALHLADAAAGVLVALTLGVAAVTFVRLIGLTALGPPPAPGRPVAGPAGGPTMDTRPGHRAAVTLLSLGCLGLGVIAPLQVDVIARGLTGIVGDAAYRGVASPWVLQPVYAGFSAASPSWLWIVIPGLLALIAGTGFLLGGRRMTRVRRVPAWGSASPGVTRGVGYTSYGFANPMRKLLTNLLLTRAQLRQEEASTGGQVGAEDAGAAGVRLGYTVDVIEIVEHYAYRPTWAALLAAARAVKRLQSGHLGAYLGYMLIAVVAVVTVVLATT